MNRWPLTFLLFIILLYTSSSPANDIGRQFTADQFREAMVGDSTTYVIRVDARRPLSLGLATIFANPSTGKLSLQGALKLANTLATKGWHVDIVTAHWIAMAASTPDMQNSDSPSDPGNWMAWQSQLEPSLDHTLLKQQLMLLLPGLDAPEINGFRLFVAEGLSAALLLALAQEDGVQLPDAAALIAPFWPTTDINNTLPQLTADYPSPLLDITYASSNRFAISNHSERVSRASVDIKLQYRNRMLPRIQNRQAIAWVGGEIVGWTRSLGW